jgi:hypothetical protein
MKMPRGRQGESCRNLEDEPQAKLQAASGVSGIVRSPKKWGGYNADEILVVDMIQNVEGIRGQFELLRVVVATLQAEGFPDEQVNIGIAWGMTCIAGYAGRTVIEYGIAVVVQPGRNIEGNSKGYSRNGSYAKAPGQIIHAN